MLFKYITKQYELHKNILSAFYRKYCLYKTKNSLFCWFFNIRSAITKKDVRMYFNKHNQSYRITNGNYNIISFFKRTALWSYENGVSQRIDWMAKSFFLDKISFKDNDIIMDVGANIGDFIHYFHEHHINIHYIAIEPSPKEFECLQQNTKYFNGKVELHNIGLWYEDNELIFYLASECADSSFIEPKQYDHKITIQSRRLDDLMPNYKIKLLKLEAEGAEPEILYGSEKILKNIEYISVDVGPERGVNEEDTLAAVANFLIKNGFKIIFSNMMSNNFYGRPVVLFQNEQ